MQIDLRKFAPGDLPDEVFQELVAGTKIESEKLTAALRDHLVLGTQQTAAALSHGVNQSQFSRRLKRIMNDAHRIGRIVALLQKSNDQVGIDEVIRLANQLLEAAHEVKKEEGGAGEHGNEPTAPGNDAGPRGQSPA
jgi:hypothetical protein